MTKTELVTEIGLSYDKIVLMLSELSLFEQVGFLSLIAVAILLLLDLVPSKEALKALFRSKKS